MPCPNHICTGISKKFLNSFCQVSDCRRGRFLDEQVAWSPMVECETYQLHRFIQIHKKPGHLRIRNRDRVPRFNLLNEKGNYAAAAAHHIPITGTADHRAAFPGSNASVCENNMLHHRLADSHRINGICRLIR